MSVREWRCIQNVRSDDKTLRSRLHIGFSVKADISLVTGFRHRDYLMTKHFPFCIVQYAMERSNFQNKIRFSVYSKTNFQKTISSTD